MSEQTTQGRASTAEVEEAMKDVVDPELGINVVDLGLVYGVHVDPVHQPEVDHVDAQLRVDDVLHRLFDIGDRGAPLCRLLTHDPTPSSTVSVARSAASLKAIQPSSAHLTRAG